MYCKDRLLYYDLDAGVECFSTMVGAELPYAVIQPHQTHTDRIAIVDRANMTREDLEGYDALITQLPGVAIGVRTADCVPVLLYDPEKEVVAAIHSGWKGTVRNIVGQTCQKMSETFGSHMENTLAEIGPAISVEAFQVGPEVVEQFAQAGFRTEEISEERGVRVDGDIRTGLHIDLWKAIQSQLLEAGVQDKHIQIAGICTYAREDFHSARRESNNKCERIINAIKLL